jgi:hypothetical protein
MQTYSLNNLAEQLERDRSTMVKAMRNVPPDARVKNRPTWKIATASRALEAYTRAQDGGGRGTGTGQIDPQLAGVYAKFDTADAAMRKLKTLDARRKAAIAMAPLIADTDAMMRKVGLANGVDSELVHLRADKLFLLYLRGFEACCGWSQQETWEVMDHRD